MFVEFLYELRRRLVPVGMQEAVAVAAALSKGLHDSSLEGFYHVARALMIHSEAHLPFVGALLKKEQDVDAVSRYDSQGGKFPARWSDLGPRYNQ